MKHSSRTIHQVGRYPITLKNILVSSAIQSGNMGNKPSRLTWDIYIVGNKGEKKITMGSVFPQSCCLSSSPPGSGHHNQRNSQDSAKSLHYLP